MHGVEAKNCLTCSGGWLPPQSAMVICQHLHIKDVNNICWLIPWSFASIYILKMLIIFAGLFHGHLPSYRQVKTSIALCSAIFDWKGKNDGYFRQLWLVSASILPSSN